MVHKLPERLPSEFIGKNIKETINWSITIKNNKNNAVRLIIEDQFPVSENSSIVIERLEASNGHVEEKTGKVTWNLELKPQEKRELTLMYSVKYPRRMDLQVE